MDRYRTLERHTYRQRLGVALLAGSLLIAACSDNNSEQEPGGTSPTISGPPQNTAEMSVDVTTTLPLTTTTESTPNTTELSAEEECSFRYVEPGEHFNPEKSDQISEDLDLLKKLHTDGTELELSDVGTAAGIIRKSYRDPFYAEGMVIAKDAAQEQSFLTADDFLNLELSQLATCDNNHLESSDSRAQLQRTDAVADTLLRRIGERIGSQTSAAIRQAYETLEENVRELIEEFENEQ